MDTGGLPIFILNDDSLHIKPDGALNFYSKFFVSKDNSTWNNKTKTQHHHYSRTPSLYFITNGALFKIEDDTSLSHARSQNYRIFTTFERLTPQSSKPLDNVIRFPYEYKSINLKVGL